MGRSNNREAMAFSPASLREIAYPEVRPKLSWLSNRKTVAELGINFAPPEKTVERKVALIDEWQSQNGEVTD
jgi:hypothetical protein